MKTSAMAGDASKAMTGNNALQTNRIQALTGDGFEIGNHSAVNQSGQTYHWIAFGAGSDIDVGAYTGNAATQAVTGIGFSPEMVWSLNAAAQSVRWESSLSTATFDFNQTSYGTAGFTSLNADGFTVDSSTALNGSGNTVYYIAFNQNADYFSLNTYVGNSVNNRNITGVGFEPELVFVRETTGSNFVDLKTESSGYNTNVAGGFGNFGQTYANYIKALQSDGFQVGTDPDENASGRTYAYFAFKQHDAPLIVDTTSDTSDGTVTSINALRANKGADGKISLREAIAAANATHNGTIADQIQFNIAGRGSPDDHG
ncbi:MAG: hypothetical protein R3C56_21360 [Pirellulaceae bacterium]